MKVVMAVALAAITLSGCASVSDTTGGEQIRVKSVDGYTCIFWQPFEGSGEGAQMECFERE